MDEMVERAAALAAAPDSVTLTVCREGYFPHELKVVECRTDDLSNLWIKVQADAFQTVILRQGVRAGVCMRRGRDSVTVSGPAVSVDNAGQQSGGIVSGKGYCTLNLVADGASVWIDGQMAHYEFKHDD